ncbi:MAG: hypothetical protein ACJ8AW_51010, partial [Rhodopila sp.]
VLDGRAKPGHDAVGTTAPLVFCFNAYAATPGQSHRHVYHNAWAGLDQWDPAVNTFLRGNGKASGRPDGAKLEALRGAWLAASTPDEQKRLARQIQLQVLEDVPYIPIGQSFAPIAYRNDLSGLLTGYSLFWNVRRG